MSEAHPLGTHGLQLTLIWQLCSPTALPCSHQSPSVLVPALRTVGNIVTGDDMQTQVCAPMPPLYERPLAPGWSRPACHRQPAGPTLFAANARAAPPCAAAPAQPG